MTLRYLYLGFQILLQKNTLWQVLRYLNQPAQLEQPWFAQMLDLVHCELSIE